jgi:pimeloyl-ACP methyl ester carboxylesterase
LGKKVNVPILVIQGEKDLQAPASLAKAYVDEVNAPRKKYVELKGDGHTAVLILGDLFLKEILAFTGSQGWIPSGCVEQ